MIFASLFAEILGHGGTDVLHRPRDVRVRALTQHGHEVTAALGEVDAGVGEDVVELLEQTSRLAERPGELAAPLDALLRVAHQPG
jgi:hypothetical protein